LKSLMKIDASFGGSNALSWILDQRVATGECNFTSNYATNNMTVGIMTKLRRLGRRMTRLGRTVGRVTRLGGTAGKRMTITQRCLLQRVDVSDDHDYHEVKELVS
jgi:hypothetical protein